MISRSLRNLVRCQARNLSYVPIDDHFFGLNDEEIELRSTVRKFFETEIPRDLGQK